MGGCASKPAPEPPPSQSEANSGNMKPGLGVPARGSRPSGGSGPNDSAKRNLPESPGDASTAPQAPTDCASSAIRHMLDGKELGERGQAMQEDLDRRLSMERAGVDSPHRVDETPFSSTRDMDGSVHSVRSVRSIERYAQKEHLKNDDRNEFTFKSPSGEEVQLRVVSRYDSRNPEQAGNRSQEGSRRGAKISDLKLFGPFGEDASNHDDEQDELMDVLQTRSMSLSHYGLAHSVPSSATASIGHPQTSDAFACMGFIQMKVRNTSTTSDRGAETETVTVTTTHVPLSRPLPVCVRYEHVLGMLSSMLQCDVVEVKFTDEEMQWHVSVAEDLQTTLVERSVLEGLQSKAKAEVMSGQKLCPLMMLPAEDDCIIVPDMQEDSRYKLHPMVVGSPNVRFFAAAWLTSMGDWDSGRRSRDRSNLEKLAPGRKYGMLYLADKAPRNPSHINDIRGILLEAAKVLTMTIDEYKLDVIKDLLVQDRRRRRSVQLEGDEAAVAAHKSPSIFSSFGDMPWMGDDLTDDVDEALEKMKSAVDCFQDGCMLLECIVGTKFAIGWNVLHVNSALSRQLECEATAMIGSGFWEFFMTDISERSYTNALIRENRPFELTVTFQNTLHPKPAVHELEFRPAVSLGSPGAGTPASSVSLSPQNSGRRTRDFKRISPSSISGAKSERVPNSASAGSASGELPLGKELSSILSSIVSRGEHGQAPRSHVSTDSRRCSGEVKRYFFAHVKMSTKGGIGVRERSLQLSKEAPRVFKDIRLGPLIGRGAYGRVYRGNWNGNIVAVKVIASEERLHDEVKDRVSSLNRPDAKGLHEAVLSAALSHPNVLHTYQYSFRQVPASGKDDTSNHVSEKQEGSLDSGKSRDERKISELWLVSEYCNRGPLLTAIENGLFTIQASNTQEEGGPSTESHTGSQTNLIYILQTAQEISAAMEYLHGHDVVHGDLTGGNVLLQSSDKDGRGFTAKVVDFGLSRVCAGGSLKTSKMGCAEYMPPELITRGLLTKSGDVYAFGVILWELYMGKRAWAGVQPADVLAMVSKGESLEFPPQTPRRLKILGERCLSTSPEARPAFSDVVYEVNTILSDTMTILRKFLGIAGS